MSIFDKWNSQVNGSALADEVRELDENSGQTDYKEVPYGEYEVKVEKMELKECQSDANKGLPMLSIQFRILEGEFKNSCIFMNQLVFKSYPLHVANEFLRSLDSGIEVEFDGNYARYNDLILDICENINNNGLEYLLDYSQTKKGYNQFKIVEIYDDLPF